VSFVIGGGSLDSEKDVSLPEYATAINSGIQVTVKIAGVEYMSYLPIDTDPERIGLIVANTVRKAPKTVKWE
jgi:hypothetical protein